MLSQTLKRSPPNAISMVQAVHEPANSRQGAYRRSSRTPHSAPEDTSSHINMMTGVHIIQIIAR